MRRLHVAIVIAIVAAFALVGLLDRPEFYPLESSTVRPVVNVVPLDPARCAGLPLADSTSDRQGLFFDAALRPGRRAELLFELVRICLALPVENLVENPANAVFTPCPIVWT